MPNTSNNSEKTSSKQMENKEAQKQKSKASNSIFFKDEPLNISSLPDSTRDEKIYDYGVASGYII